MMGDCFFFECVGNLFVGCLGVGYCFNGGEGFGGNDYEGGCGIEFFKCVCNVCIVDV